MNEQQPLISNDAAVLGLLFVTLALVFYTSSLQSRFWKRFYSVVPSLLLCYFIPSLFNTFHIISGESSQLYKIVSRYLLPASLVLLTVSIDLKGIMRLGPKALAVFLAGTFSVMLGGPLAMMIVMLINPSLAQAEAGEEVWRGLATIAGSWIGGGANQTAMKEIFGAGDKIFSTMITVDVLVANLWTAVLLLGIARAPRIDRFMKADTRIIEEVRKRIEDYQASIAQMPKLKDTMMLMAVAFGCTGLAHLVADYVVPALAEHEAYLESIYMGSIISAFFWIVLVATTLGLLLSFTPARNLEGVGASRLGSVFLYLLVATIGMQMDVLAIFSNLSAFLIGIVWMLLHIIILLITARVIRAPFFFVAVGSMANIGGAASAPIVASVYHPTLAPVGVLLAVLGYALGTYGAWLSGIAMQWLYNWIL